MCMSSECESDGEHSTTEDTDHQKYDTKNILVHFTALKQERSLSLLLPPR